MALHPLKEVEETPVGVVAAHAVVEGPVSRRLQIDVTESWPSNAAGHST